MKWMKLSFAIPVFALFTGCYTLFLPGDPETTTDYEQAPPRPAGPVEILLPIFVPVHPIHPVHTTPAAIAPPAPAPPKQSRDIGSERGSSGRASGTQDTPRKSGSGRGGR